MNPTPGSKLSELLEKIRREKETISKDNPMRRAEEGHQDITPVVIPTPVPTNTTISVSKLDALRAKLGYSVTEPLKKIPLSITSELQEELSLALEQQKSEPEDTNESSHILDKYGNAITLNSKQMEFVSIAVSGKSAVLIGAAGTGKTTTQKAVTQELELNGMIPPIRDTRGHKHIPAASPGIIVCAYTRRAVANIRKNLPEHLRNNAMTIHKLLEYQPVYNTVIDPETGNERTKMQFEATRHSGNPLPQDVKIIIFEEASMLALDLYKEVIDACNHKVQFIFLGDIQQLPPVFGPAILGFKLLELPVVELTEVYRQALESPIISLAHRILSGRPIPAKEFPEWNKPGQMTIRPWKKKISALDALNTAGLVFIEMEKQGLYDPEEDVILIPFNKSFGTDELNKKIANHLAHKRGEYVYEIVSGFTKLYLSVGDKVLFDKEDATVIDIDANPTYTGARPLPESKTLDYWGYDPVFHDRTDSDSEDAMDFLLTQVASADSEDRVRQGSHIITLRMNDSEKEIKIQNAGDINAMLLGYCLTVHKSQGSEWRKVFLVLHESHATMISRELLYTGITRAREELYIICEPESLTKGINSQRVKGNTLQEKAEFFKGKIEAGYKLEGY